MSKDMRDSPRANLGFAANMFKHNLYTWLYMCLNEFNTRMISSEYIYIHPIRILIDARFMIYPFNFHRCRGGGSC